DVPEMGCDLGLVRAVPTECGHPLTVGRKGNPPDNFARVGNLAQLLSRRHLPEVDLLLVSAGDQNSPIGREGCSHEVALMLPEFSTVGDVPEANTLIVPRGGQGVTVRGKGELRNVGCMPSVELADRLARDRVPQSNGIVAGCGG